MSWKERVQGKSGKNVRGDRDQGDGEGLERERK